MTRDRACQLKPDPARGPEAPSPCASTCYANARKLTEDSIRRELAESQALVGDLQHRTLAEFLPICMYCKNIRDDDGTWSTLERYIGSHAGSQFTHGLCPDCMARFMKENGLE